MKYYTENKKVRKGALLHSSYQVSFLRIVKDFHKWKLSFYLFKREKILNITSIKYKYLIETNKLTYFKIIF